MPEAGGAWPQWFTDSTPELKAAVPSNVLYVFGNSGKLVAYEITAR